MDFPPKTTYLKRADNLVRPPLVCECASNCSSGGYRGVSWLMAGHKTYIRRFVVELIVFFDEFDNVRVEIEDLLVEFEVVNLFYSFGDVFRIVEYEYAHSGRL
jgi:hypothetical protein